MSQEWRAVLVFGVVQGVNVHAVEMGGGTKWTVRKDHAGPWFDTPRMAVASLALSPERMPIVEIRGPGELTAAEQVEAMRARCEAACNATMERLQQEKADEWESSTYDERNQSDALISGAYRCIQAVEALKP